ncbi:MAG TPA: ABC transporter substrate-binding protein [Bryobacteraceae bacterium]|nr:ABC transporter substrate-binding protein [Bryobacteraceae bacterium]
MRRRDLIGGLGLLAAGCTSTRKPAELREISVALSEHLSTSSMHLADEAGYLREAGFRMNVVRLSAIQAVPLLAGGRLDAILGGVPAPLLNGVLRGMAIRVVAGREHVSPACGDGYTLYARRAVFGKGPVDPRRLKGKRFSIRSRGITEFILDTFLKELGMELGDVERIDLPLRESLAALASGQIDAIFDPEVSRSALADSGELVKVWRLADVLPMHQYSFVIFGESLLKTGVEPGARLLAAYLQAAGEFLEGRTPRFMREFAERHGLDPEKTAAECRDTFARDGAIDRASLQRTLDWHAGKGYATARLEAGQLVDERFLEEARRMLASGEWRVSRHGGEG